MDLLIVCFETDCKDARLLRPVAEKVRRSRELRWAEVRKGAIGFDLLVHVLPGTSAGRAEGIVRPLVPPGVLVTRTSSVMGERSQDDDASRRDDPDEIAVGGAGLG
jgi:hypothetical protein